MSGATRHGTRSPFCVSAFHGTFFVHPATIRNAMARAHIRSGWVPCLLLLLAGGGRAEVWTEDTYRNTLYYRTTFAAASSAAGLLHIAAVDSFAAYFNGVAIGANAAWNQVHTYPVDVISGDNTLAVEVVNRGLGVGHGLLAAVAVDSLYYGATDPKAEAWYWTAHPPADTDWHVADSTAQPGWQVVQAGSAQRTLFEGLPDPALDLVAGFPGGTDIGRVAGGVVLKPIRGENLAVGRPSNRIEAVDGNLHTAWEPPVSSVNFAASIDLQQRRLIRAVRVLTEGPEFAQNSLQGYSVQVSDNEIRWSEVGVLHDILQFERTEVVFNPTWTRFVRIVIIDVNGVSQPKVAEIQVFGEGFAEEGVFLSEPLALGAPDRRKNFGRITWNTDIPLRTDLSVQFRSGATLDAFADPQGGWSDPQVAGGGLFPGPEPGRFLQYRVNMESRDPAKSPLFRDLRIEYSTEDIAASTAQGRVAPNRVPMGVDTTFVYTLDVEVGAGDQGVQSLQIAVPGPAQLSRDMDLGTAVLAEWFSTQHVLTLIFAEPLRQSSQLQIPFRTRSYAHLHRFRAFLFSPNSENPLNVAPNQAQDPRTQKPHSWTLVTTTVADQVLDQVRANPPIFSPNGDGINDATVIELVLASVDVARPVSMHIFDLSGHPVARLRSPALSAGAYLRRSGRERESPGYWDGRDDRGHLVPPGLYLFQVKIELDVGAAIHSGCVAVVY